MQRKILVIGIIILAIISCSCWAIRQGSNRQGLMLLEIGMSKQEMLKIMGMPSLNEAYKMPNEGIMEVFFYYTHRKWADYNTTKDECTPVVLENGEIVGWGDNFYDNKMRYVVEIIKKQKERTSSVNYSLPGSVIIPLLLMPMSSLYSTNDTHRALLQKKICS